MASEAKERIWGAMARMQNDGPVESREPDTSREMIQTLRQLAGAHELRGLTIDYSAHLSGAANEIDALAERVRELDRLWDQAEKHNDSLREQLAEAREDTERLDWLDDNRLDLCTFEDGAWGVERDHDSNTFDVLSVDQPTARQAIDTARRGEGEG